MLSAMTICALFMCAATVASKQTPQEPQQYRTPVSAFALKNPDAFDAARRRTVRAMHVPKETAADMASGIDAAEAEADVLSDDAPSAPPRVAEAAR